jgi:hypothetical protein
MTFFKRRGSFFILRLWRDRRDVQTWEALAQSPVEINEVGKAAHALDCSKRVAARDRILVVVTEILLNQHRLPDVDFHVTIVLRLVHFLEVLGVGRKPARVCVALAALVIRLLGGIKESFLWGCGLRLLCWRIS